jgi:hypothetical protein
MDIDTFGVTLPIRTWRILFALSGNADRAPSDYLRTIIEREGSLLKAGSTPAPATAAAEGTQSECPA